MFQKIAAVTVLMAGLAVPMQPATAQDAIGGAILGGAAGAAIGGAITGRGEGAAIGAVIGATSGALIAQEGRAYHGGYYAWRRGCYVRRPNGTYVRVRPRHCR